LGKLFPLKQTMIESESPIRSSLLSAASILLMVVAVWLYFQGDSTGDPLAKKALEGATGGVVSDPTAPPFRQTSFSGFVGGSILERIRRHEVDFVSMVNEVRERCLPEWDRDECNGMTRDFLRDKFSQDSDVIALLEVYDQYLRYENFVAETRALQDLDVAQAYQTLQHLRAQFIAPEFRRWLFGAEDARMAYELALNDFIREKALQLTPLERLRQLDLLRKQTLGEYHDLFVEREDPVLFYETQLSLLQLSALNTAEEQRLAAEIRNKILQSRSVSQANDW
jgi:hypothetical protein